MRIIHVVESLDRGGLEVMVITLLKHQIQQGETCGLICLFEQGELAPQLSDFNIMTLTCEKRNGFDLKVIKKIRSFVKMFKPDVIHTHNPLPHYYTVFASKQLKIKKIINTRHGMGRDPYSTKRELLFRLAMSNSDYCATVSHTALKRFIKLKMIPPKKSVVISNGIDLKYKQQKTEHNRQQLLKLCELAKDVNVIGTVGRLEPVKNYSMLLKAFKTIHENSESALVIVGDGAEAESLKRQAFELGIIESVRFLGARNDVQELLAGFDLFVMTSISEGYSMALLEASAAALPIIATDVGGNHEIVKHDVTGKLVTSNDHHQLAETINNLLSNKKMMTAMGIAARNWVEAHASVEVMAQKYQQLYGS